MNIYIIKQIPAFPTTIAKKFDNKNQFCASEKHWCVLETKFCELVVTMLNTYIKGVFIYFLVYFLVFFLFFLNL